jgi:hypothetical protein
MFSTNEGDNVNQTEFPTLTTPLKCEMCDNPVSLKPGSRNKYNRYCSRKCQMTRAHRKQSADLKSKGDLAAMMPGLVQPLEPHTDRDKEILGYFKEGWPWAAIANRIGVNKAYVRKRLLCLGYWKPDPKHNGTAKKGTGPQSKILKAQRNIAARKLAATCIRAFKKGVPIENTLRAQDAKTGTVWNVIVRSRAYKTLRAKKNRSLKHYEDYRRQKWTTSLWDDEAAFQNSVASELTRLGVVFIKEAQCRHSRARVDFKLSKNIFIECKVCTKPNSTDRTIGQAMRYQKLENAEVWIVIPEGLTMRTDQAKVLDMMAVRVMTVPMLASALCGVSNDNPQPATHLLCTLRTAICKCCGNDGVMSKSPSGSKRSYCIECEPTIGSRRYDGRTGRWVACPCPG